MRWDSENQESFEEKVRQMNVMKELSRVYPEELAKDDPEHYWINPKDGQCHKRGEEQFFINENGHVFRVTKEEFMRRKNYLYKEWAVKDYKPFTAKRPQDVSLAQQNHDNWEFAPL